MAKAMYIGVDGVARKVKNANIGITTQVPNVQEIAITGSNITSYFTVSNGSYYFQGTGTGYTFITNNIGKDSYTEARTVLTANQDMSVSFYYKYSGQSNDKFTLMVKDLVIESQVTSSTETIKGYGPITIAKGQQISFLYAKYSSSADTCSFYNMKVYITQGTVNKGIARNIKAGYIGINNVARQFLDNPTWFTFWSGPSGEDISKVKIYQTYAGYTTEGYIKCFLEAQVDTGGATGSDKQRAFAKATMPQRDDYSGKTFRYVYRCSGEGNYCDCLCVFIFKDGTTSYKRLDNRTSWGTVTTILPENLKYIEFSVSWGRKAKGQINLELQSVTLDGKTLFQGQ